MTKQLSPAAQMVDRAIADRIQLLGEIAPSRQVAAAALRAAADQIVPPQALCSHPDEYDFGVWEAKDWVRNGLLAIAGELEAQ
jgi:hypothetical protein